MPEVNAEAFYVVQGLVSLLATLLVVYYMIKVRSAVTRTVGQTMRYFTMLSFAVLLLYASQEQVYQNVPVASRNWVALGVMVQLTITMAVSIYELHQPKNKKSRKHKETK